MPFSPQGDAGRPAAAPAPLHPWQAPVISAVATAPGVAAPCCRGEHVSPGAPPRGTSGVLASPTAGPVP